jgi:hypothetical protein
MLLKEFLQSSCSIQQVLKCSIRRRHPSACVFNPPIISILIALLHQIVKSITNQTRPGRSWEGPVVITECCVDGHTGTDHKDQTPLLESMPDPADIAVLPLESTACSFIGLGTRLLQVTND